MGLYLYVTRFYQHDWNHNQRLNSVLINGDDQLYCAPPETYLEHVEAGLKVGLEMSVGKAYVHPRFASVNSTSVDYHIHSTNSNQTPYQIDYLNTGLFFGINKVQGDTEDGIKEHNSINVLNKVLAGSLPGRQHLLLKRWFENHSDDELKAETEVSYQHRWVPPGSIPKARKSGKLLQSFRRNIFLPQFVGGMGVDPPINWKFKITRMDCKLATILCPNHIRSLLHPKPLPFPELPEVSTLEQVPWFSFLPKEIDKTIKDIRGNTPRLWTPKQLRSLPRLFLCSPEKGLFTTR
jgi:hypothetical protein